MTCESGESPGQLATTRSVVPAGPPRTARILRATWQACATWSSSATPASRHSARAEADDGPGRRGPIGRNCHHRLALPIVEHGRDGGDACMAVPGQVRSCCQTRPPLQFSIVPHSSDYRAQRSSRRTGRAAAGLEAAERVVWVPAPVELLLLEVAAWLVDDLGAELGDVGAVQDTALSAVR